MHLSLKNLPSRHETGPNLSYVRRAQFELKFAQRQDVRLPGLTIKTIIVNVVIMRSNICRHSLFAMLDL